VSRRIISSLGAKIAKNQDGILACYEIIAEHQPKLDRMKRREGLRCLAAPLRPSNNGWRAPGSKGHDPYQGLDTDRGSIFLETFHDVD